MIFMDRSGLQRLTPVILILLIVVIAVAALFSLGRTLFTNNSTNTPNATTEETAKEALTNVLANRSVVMTVRGPIVANENFHSYKIAISPDSRNMTTYTGYIRDVVAVSQLSNNSQAYTQFVYALDREKLMNGTPFEGRADDTRGICPTGLVYEFSVLKDQDIVRKLWTSTCPNARGSLRATSLQRVTSLFKKQIPEFNTLASKVKLSS